MVNRQEVKVPGVGMLAVSSMRLTNDQVQSKRTHEGASDNRSNLFGSTLNGAQATLLGPKNMGVSGKFQATEEKKRPVETILEMDKLSSRDFDSLRKPNSSSFVLENKPNPIEANRNITRIQSGIES
jgi:hypothetical protein